MNNKAKKNRKNLNYLGITANNVPVFDRANSHFEDHNFSKEIMVEALSKITQVSQFEKHVVNMGKIIGVTSCVQIKEGEQVIMAVRKKRLGPTPMVLNREPEPCESIVVILKKCYDDEGMYFILITAFVGKGSEPEPWDKQLKPGSPEYMCSVKFWQTHALIYDEEVIDYILY